MSSYEKSLRRSHNYWPVFFHFSVRAAFPHRTISMTSYLWTVPLATAKSSIWQNLWRNFFEIKFWCHILIIMTYKQQEVLKLRHLYHIFVLSLNRRNGWKRNKTKNGVFEQKKIQNHILKPIFLLSKLSKKPNSFVRYIHTFMVVAWLSRIYTCLLIHMVNP